MEPISPNPILMVLHWNTFKIMVSELPFDYVDSL